MCAYVDASFRLSAFITLCIILFREYLSWILEFTDLLGWLAGELLISASHCCNYRCAFIMSGFLEDAVGANSCAHTVLEAPDSW